MLSDKLKSVVVDSGVIDPTIGYVIGGYGGGVDPDNDAYTASSNSWASRTSMGTALHSMMQNRLSEGDEYMFGGRVSDGSRQTTCQSYNDSADSYTTQTSLPSPARHHGSTSNIDDKFYIFGGYS
tara:strand:- start:149 stop:523 length:375 start_codon:yes stop_codon:yes gene_type:complete